MSSIKSRIYTILSIPWVNIILAFVCLSIVIVIVSWSTIYQNQQKELFIFYQGWKDNNTLVYTWSALKYDKRLNGNGLKEISDFLKKENGFEKVIILQFQRFEE